MLFVGTNTGRLVTFRLLPEPGRGYAVQPVGTTSLDGKIISVSTLNAYTGAPADASQSVFAELRNGVNVNGVVLAVSNSGAKIYKPAAAKGAHKSWDEFACHAANVVHFGSHGYVLVGLFGEQLIPLSLTLERY